MIRIKKLDQLLASNFVGPFVVTFFIALFVLVMQTLWVYIDDIAGKGIGFFLMTELLGYMSVSMIPLALPIAVLISSVMVLGNLAERYELSSIKSAGVSLARIMMPLAVLAFLIAGFSFFCSNNLIPISNLKFKSRLHDIRKQKPTLNLEEGIFNDDFRGYSIRIGNKYPDNRTIEDVMIIDHKTVDDGVLLEIVADKGEMFVTEDERYFVMNLYEGWQYQELEKSGSRSSESEYSFIRTHFKEWSKVFDLSEFELARTDEELFKSHQTMLNVGQLTSAIDSIDLVIQDRIENLQKTSQKYFTPLEEEAKVEPDSLEEESEKVPSASSRRRGQNPLSQSDLGQLDSLGSIMETFPKYKRPELYNRAKTYARSMNSQSGSAARSIKSKLEARVNHVFEMHNKFSMAVACILFLFIGAPMGAIVRKGGFGYPLLISILFFMFYMILTIFSKNIAERFVIDAMLAAWLPCLILFPISMVLTYQAMNDYKNILFFDILATFFAGLAGFFRGRKVKQASKTVGL